jgi:hypothetical protein
MPQIPIFNSNRNIQANPVAPQQTGTEQPFIDQQKVIKTVGDITQKWSDAQDVMQYTDAKAKQGIATAEIQARASADQDFNNAPKYQAELEKVKTETLKGISSGAVKQKASVEFDYDNQIAGIKIGAEFQGKQLKYNKVQVKNNLDILQQKKLQATTPSEKSHIDAEIQTLLNAQVASGVLSYDEADKELKDAQTTSVKYQIYADTSTKESDSSVLKELQSPNSDMSKELDPKTRLSLIEDAQRRIFQNNQTYKREANIESEARTNKLIKDLSDRAVDLKRIDDEFDVPEEVGGVNRETLRNFKKVVIEGNTDTLTRIIDEGDRAATSYYEAFDTILNQEDRSRAKELIVKAMADKNLSFEEGALLDGVLKETGKSNPLGIAVRNVWRGMLGYKRSDKEAGLSLHELIQRARDGIDPIVASKQILTERAVIINPDLGKVTETPSLFMAGNGAIKEVTMKDGFLNFTSPKKTGTK